MISHILAVKTFILGFKEEIIDLTSSFKDIKNKSLLKYSPVKVIGLGKISVLNGQRKGFASRWYLN